MSLGVVVPCGHTHCAAKDGHLQSIFFPNFDGRQSITARIRAHASHSAFYSLSTTSFHIGLTLPSILEIYVSFEPGCSGV